MNAIPANQLKTRGVSVLAEGLKNEPVLEETAKSVFSR